MSRIIPKKQAFWHRCVLLCTVLCAVLAHAQPGWRDLTTRYFYTVLDAQGKEISFKNNPEYSIMVDGMLYRSPNIRQDSLKYARAEDFNYEQGFQNQVKINNFSLANFQNGYAEKKHLEIRIIYNKDTLYLSQPTGTGSYWDAVTPQGRQLKFLGDYTLRFIPGRYYFPAWAKWIIDTQPVPDGNVRIVNLDQRHFILPKDIVEAGEAWNIRNGEFTKANSDVANRFTEGYFSVERRTEPTRFTPSALPYQNPGWSGPLYPSKDPDRYYGMMRYFRNTSDCSSSLDVFSVLNRSANTVEQFFPQKNPRLFSGIKLYSDKFNGTLYLQVSEKKQFNVQLSDCQNTFPSQIQMYRSRDEGKTWKRTAKTGKMFAGYGFSEFEFLDRNYSLGYARTELKQEKKGTQIIQGTYYLLRNGKVTDSLKTPDDLYYNSNYNNYYFSAKNDTVSLGSWTYDDHYTVNTTRYFQPLLVRSKGEWKFKVEEKIYRRPVPAMGQTAYTVREFVNFRLINGRKMIFRNGAGSLELKQEVKDEVSGDGCYILEQGSRIYLISPGVHGSVYISFDAGTNWYLYPRPLQPGRSLLLQPEGPNGLSYFSTESAGGTSVMRKIFYDFLPR